MEGEHYWASLININPLQIKEHEITSSSGARIKKKSNTAGRNLRQAHKFCELNERHYFLTAFLFLFASQAGLQLPLFTTLTAAPACSPWRKPSAAWSRTPSATTC